ncbi:MAG: hypothetical protein JNL90_02640 [Planctomycetes bacterium]|nr:hypothetical protein [Planctomycetota bacterium]
MTSPMKPSPQPTEPARKPVAPNSSPNAPKGGMPKESQNDSKHSPSRPTQNDSKQPAGSSNRDANRDANRDSNRDANRDSKGSNGDRKDDSAPIDPSRPILGGSVKLAPSSDGSTDDACDPTAKSGDACATPRGATPRNAVNPANPAKSAGS